MSARNTIRFVAGDAELLTHVDRLFLEHRSFLATQAGPVAPAVLERFDQELKSLPGPYAPPGGFILLAVAAGELLGCVALRPLDPPAVAEMKRLYVREGYRSGGIGRTLVEALLHEARALGYERVRLDTLPGMQTAERLYRSLGFRDIAPYGVNQLPGALFLERSLRESTDCTVRRATMDDASGILACLNEAFAPYRAQYTPAAYADTVPTPESLRKRFGTMTLFVAIAQSVIGTIGAEVLGGGTGHLRGMAVVPAYQGRGVADALLDAALADLRERACARVTLDTTAPLDRAIHFYESHGFRATGRVNDFFGMPLYELARDLKAASRPERVDYVRSDPEITS
jgi:ribosomal protein S18 acetylase RimI-like enzyme